MIPPPKRGINGMEEALNENSLDGDQSRVTCQSSARGEEDAGT